MDSGRCVISACKDWLRSTAGVDSPLSPFLLRKDAWCVSIMGIGDDCTIPRGELFDIRLLESESSKPWSSTPENNRILWSRSV